MTIGAASIIVMCVCMYWCAAWSNWLIVHMYEMSVFLLLCIVLKYKQPLSLFNAIDVIDVLCSDLALKNKSAFCLVIWLNARIGDSEWKSEWNTKLFSWLETPNGIICSRKILPLLSFPCASKMWFFKFAVFSFTTIGNFFFLRVSVS